MENQVAIIERELSKVENMVLNKAVMVKDFNNFLNFYYTYLINYIPTLEFAIECLPENSIAKLANFGMLIDHISAIELDRVIAFQMDITAKEIADNTKQPKSIILKGLNNISIAQKIQISSAILLSSSISRDFSLSLATSKFNAINQIIAWSNIFGQLANYPALIETLITEEILDKAEDDLLKAKDLIQKRDRSYDYILACDWFDNVEFSRSIIQEIPKLLVGPKLAWLEAMEGLELAKCVIRKDAFAGQKALNYNEKILKIIKNQNLSKNEWSYRSLNSGGPCCNIKSIVDLAGNGRIRLSLVDSHTILVQSKKEIFFLVVPSNFNFYVNSNMRIQISNDLSIPITHDLNAIISFYKNPAHFVANNIESLSSPEDSFYYSRKVKDRENIQTILKDVDSIITKLSITYGGNLDKTISELAGKSCTTTLDGLLIYGLIFGVENLAKNAGLPIETQMWSETRLAITSIFLSRISLFSRYMDKAKKEGKLSPDNGKTDETVVLTIEDKMTDFYKRIEKSHEEFDKTMKELKDEGLIDLMDISFNIRKILLSGLSMEEIKEKLQAYFESL